MYSLLCRHARISAFRKVHEDDAKPGSSAGPADGPEPGSRSLLERSRPMQKALLAVVLIGTAFMMCDGVLSPATSGGFDCFARAVMVQASAGALATSIPVWHSWKT